FYDVTVKTKEHGEHTSLYSIRFKPLTGFVLFTCEGFPPETSTT
ncbi:MAG: hypothetical protein ACJA16_003657, partial [Akkermansiaceae bacterium]